MLTEGEVEGEEDQVKSKVEGEVKRVGKILKSIKKVEK